MIATPFPPLPLLALEDAERDSLGDFRARHHQVLVHERLLERFDYLPTVSGGGYLGAFPSTCLGSPAQDADQSGDRNSRDDRRSFPWRRRPASANMGAHTLRHLRFLLTLLNVRLGYWLRNPLSGARHWWNALGPRTSYER